MPGHLRVIFSASNLIGSMIIRLLTWSSWSHVAVLFDENLVVEAAYPKVRELTLDEFLKDKTLTLMVDFPCVSPADSLAFLRTQVGKRYDLNALFAFLLHNRAWDDDKEWFCSELVARALAEGGTKYFRSEYLHRVTPQHLWLLNTEALGD